MRNNQRNDNIHTYLFILLCVALAILAAFGTFFRGQAASPSSGTIATTGPVLPFTGTWAGDPTLATGATGGEGQCIDSGPAKNCDSFALTVAGNTSDGNGKLIQVKVDWNLASHDYDLYIHKRDLSGQVAASGTNGRQMGTAQNAYVD